MSAAFSLSLNDDNMNHDASMQPSSDRWLGTPGAQIRLTGHVERITTGSNGLKRYLIRDEETQAAVEWASPRRYQIQVGDRLQMSGVVRRHVHAGNDRVTVLHHCFNPMRLN